MSELNLTHSNGNKVKLTTPDTLATNKTFKLPGADGSSGQFLKTDGSGALSFGTPAAETGTTLQRQFKYLIDTGQLAKGGSIGELTTSLRIAFTPKFADSNLLMEIDTSYVSPNSSNLYYCLFYDVTNSAGVSLPAAAGSRVRCHWTKRSSPNDNNDNDHLSMRIVTPANNTNARTYTIHFGSEGAQAQFFVSTLSTGGGSTYPMTFTITEIAS